jgi:hypothetical protein
MLFAVSSADGHKPFRSTKQRDRKKAGDVCRALEKASEKGNASVVGSARKK